MRRFFLLCSLFFPFLLFAQNGSIFPNLEDDDLLDALVEEYKPNPVNVMSYGEARDVLFGIIDRKDGKVACIYSDHQVNLPDGQDPTTYIYQNGSPNGINTEHSFPQSMGAEFGAAKSDMHHLFPARVAVNTARASLPFAEIQDFETDVWYYKNEEQSNIPSTNKDAYSEGTNAQFEPREEVKGDIARAMFYFYTMYKNQADAANSTFFAGQRSRLCQWHAQDPPNQEEINRSNLIAVYQDEKANPFVLDCTVAERCYCPDNPPCFITSVNDLVEVPKIELFPNPTNGILHITIENTFVDPLLFQLWDGRGTLQKEILLSQHNLTISLDSLSSGIYFYSVKDEHNPVSLKQGRLLIL